MLPDQGKGRREKLSSLGKILLILPYKFRWGKFLSLVQILSLFPDEDFPNNVV